jgi:hypothetical protein
VVEAQWETTCPLETPSVSARTGRGCFILYASGIILINATSGLVSITSPLLPAIHPAIPFRVNFSAKAHGDGSSSLKNNIPSSEKDCCVKFASRNVTEPNEKRFLGLCDLGVSHASIYRTFRYAKFANRPLVLQIAILCRLG